MRKTKTPVSYKLWVQHDNRVKLWDLLILILPSNYTSNYTMVSQLRKLVIWIIYILSNLTTINLLKIHLLFYFDNTQSFESNDILFIILLINTKNSTSVQSETFT